MHITRCIIPVTACFFILCHCIQAIFESEKELEETGVSIDLDQAFEKLNKKYYG